MSFANKRCSSIKFARPSHIGVALRWPARLDSFLRACRHVLERRKQRQALLELDDYMLRDIGVSREEALREGTKWWWK